MDADTTGTYAGITETPGVGATREQLRMLATRYDFAARHAQGKRVLEVACGTGIGLGYLMERGAAEVMGCDIDPTNVGIAQATYFGKLGISVFKDNADTLSSVHAPFDVIVCFEAIYYFRSLSGFLSRCGQLLQRGGTLILCSVNPHWSGFSPSPFATRYWTPRELAGELSEAGFTHHFYSAFEDFAPGAHAKLVSAVRRTAARLHLIPQTMRGKVLLKRIFLGGTTPMPRQLSVNGAMPPHPLQPLSAKADSFQFKVFYVAATRS